jgi:type IV pilus assembly protein PilW
MNGYHRNLEPVRRLALRCCGHTLLELLIAMALGVVVTGCALLLYRTQRQAFTDAANAASMHDAGVTALMLIGQQVQMAGFAPPDAPPGTASPGLFGCTGARPAGADDAFVCQSLASRSDGIVVRYVGDAVSTWPNAAGQATDCLGQGVGVSGQAALVVNRYYARASASTGQPELYCEGNGRRGVGQPLVEGVERLRIRYWTPGAPAAADASAVAPVQWADVVAVDLCVLVRGAPAAQRTRYVDCDGAAAQSSDRHARQAFWRHVALRNSMAVPQ